VVNLSSGHVERNVLLGPFIHANGDGDEIVAIEKIALADERVQAEIAKLELPEGTVVISESMSMYEMHVRHTLTSYR
jgi:primary-amine oxidase